METAWTEKADDFLGHLGAERRSEAYRNNVKAILRRFGERIGGKDPAKVTKADVEGWLTELNGRLAPSTVGGYLTILKAAMRFWQGDGETPACVKGLKLAGLRETRVRSPKELVTEDDYRKLLSVMAPEKALIFRLLWDTGARAGEVLNLRKEDVDFRKDGDVDLSFRKTKNGGSRTVSLIPQLSGETIQVLRDRSEITPPDGYLFPSPSKEGIHLQVPGVWRYLNRVKERAGIDRKLWLHLFRNTATARFRGLPGGLRREMMGWAPGSKMEDRYDVLDTDALRQALHDLAGPMETRTEAIQRHLNAVVDLIVSIPNLEGFLAGFPDVTFDEKTVRDGIKELRLPD